MVCTLVLPDSPRNGNDSTFIRTMNGITYEVLSVILHLPYS